MIRAIILIGVIALGVLAVTHNTTETLEIPAASTFAPVAGKQTITYIGGGGGGGGMSGNTVSYKP